MEELTVTEIDEIVIIKKMQAMCEESCSPDQFKKWEKLKSHLMVTRKNLRAAQQGVQSDGVVLVTQNGITRAVEETDKSCIACGAPRR